MIRLFFEITERGPSVVIYGSKEYLHKKPSEEYLADIMTPLLQRVLKEMSTVQQALGTNTAHLKIPADAAKPALIGETGISLHTMNGPAILCLRCGRVSYNPKDIEHKYCGACHLFHET